MRVWDPRTAIARALSESDRERIASTSLTIAEALAQWLTMQADEMNDERSVGYRDLAERLTAR